MNLLEVKDITVNFGGHCALDKVSLPVERSSLTGLIGPNGAGKTTLFNAISGLLAPSSGQIVFSDKDITRKSPSQRARLGMARTFQRLELFTSLSVRENIQVAGEIYHPLNRQRNTKETERIIELTGLGEVADSAVSEIPTGLARIVELGRALATNPQMLLLDEPASGQTEEETLAFGELLKGLVDEGFTIFLVEHDMALVMSVCDVLHVLDFGRIIARGTPAEIQNTPEVLEAYLGTSQNT